MLAMRFEKPAAPEDNPLKPVQMDLPEPGPGQVLLEVSVCGVCHTDLHIVEGDIHPPHLPVTPGHQVVGRITAAGPGVSGPSVGQRVGVPWLFQADGTCEYCRRGQENLCPNARFTGFDVDGGFAECMLAQAAYVLPLPKALSDLQAAPLLCAGIIGYRSLRRAGLQPGERLGLVGFGASAHLAIQVARFWAARYTSLPVRPSTGGTLNCWARFGRARLARSRLKNWIVWSPLRRRASWCPWR